MDNIAPIVGAVLFVLASLAALYQCVILPGYERDRRHARDIS